ncbi:FecR domain-containing protein [Sphingomonas sp. NFR15]|uniref:FecR family protein n=1 Tax=Sphingomonas sp. NFR15 TaxID=1566282 RepID=UPI0008839270|nr:FecR domain-containing protein [Sphingomonas sp. NFR15]SDA12552.1 FecR family protein [Sphingomonas sp. NFR15]
MTSAPDPDPISEAAIAWAVRVSDPAFADWEAFSDWLGAAPAHADAYHEAETALADGAALMARAKPRTPAARVQPHTVEAPARRAAPRRWAWAGAAVAASLAAVIGIDMRGGTAASQVYETAPGVQRTIALADGSEVKLNGGTRLIVGGRDARALSLARGEALFTVKHDAARPFSVRVGTAWVVDIGTRFDIVRESDTTRVAVSEGEIDWRRGGVAVRVTAGRSLRARDGSNDVRLANVAQGAVGGWSQGQLQYDGTELSEVATDLARTLGVTVSVDGAIETRPVRGVVQLEGGARAVFPRLAALIGVRAKREGAKWRLLASP